ncbi:MAG TPA: pyridoxamine 5'-phosphate oxidase family protein [Nitrososphaeraceae archaeon]|nr:pyridoxamine 5'-phosphate oxidase family protein [Nitrososphaeraceae archaeon]
MTSHSSSSQSSGEKPLVLDSVEIDNLLSMTLIANLGTIDADGAIHLIPMWFLRVENYICIPTSHHTHKYRNLRARPRASVMIDRSQAGLKLKGVLIRGHVELVEGEEARKINRMIHLKYIMPEAISDANVLSYLSKGDDVTVKVHMDQVISWNLADSKAGKALQVGGWSRPLDA